MAITNQWVGAESFKHAFIAEPCELPTDDYSLMVYRVILVQGLADDIKITTNGKGTFVAFTQLEGETIQRYWGSSPEESINGLAHYLKIDKLVEVALLQYDTVEATAPPKPRRI